MSFRCVEIGPGWGGPYINDIAAMGIPFVGIDRDWFALTILQTNYPNTIPINATGERLPLAAASVDTILIHFPHSSLLQPGLQHDPHGKGFFPEFARVLKPNGNLIIYGDGYIQTESLLTQAHPFFSISQPTRYVGAPELLEIGTDLAIELYDRFKHNPNEPVAIKISLQKNS